MQRDLRGQGSAFPDRGSMWRMICVLFAGAFVKANKKGMRPKPHPPFSLLGAGTSGMNRLFLRPSRLGPGSAPDTRSGNGPDTGVGTEVPVVFGRLATSSPPKRTGHVSTSSEVVCLFRPRIESSGDCAACDVLSNSTCVQASSLVWSLLACDPPPANRGTV